MMRFIGEMALACLWASMRVRCDSVSARLGCRFDRIYIAQVAHLAGLRLCGDGLFHVARGLQPSVAANGADPIWHVYPKGARRVARWIFVGCGAAGRGILKDPKAEERSLDCAPFLRQGKRDDKRKKMTKSIHVGGRPVWAEISLQAILRNLEIIREHVNGKSRSLDYARDDKLNDRRQKSRREASGTKTKRHRRMILAVVKSNAYGLGAVPISKALQKAGTEWFGVTCANEGD